MEKEMKTKTCKSCGQINTAEHFKTNTKLCLSCYDLYQKHYHQNYYKIHQNRLMKINLENYHLKNPEKKKMGRPRKHEPETIKMLE